MLLNEYFALGVSHDAAIAYCTIAEAQLVLGNVDGALAAYQQALERELVFPHCRTDAYLDFACLVATSKIEKQYMLALDVLDRHAERPAFPVQRYRVHGARALLLAAMGLSARAQSEARLAVAAASDKNSGFHRHPNLGVVTATDDEFGCRVAALTQSDSAPGQK